MFKHCETQGVLFPPENQSVFMLWKSVIRLRCLVVAAGQSRCRLLLKGVVLASLLCYSWCSSSYPGDQSWELTSWKLMALLISSGLHFNCVSFLVQPPCSYCFLHRDCGSNLQLEQDGPSPFGGSLHSDCCKTVGRLCLLLLALGEVKHTRNWKVNSKYLTLIRTEYFLLEAVGM